MKLKFLQSGGTFNPRYSVYEPYFVPREETSDSKTSSDKKSRSNAANNDILKMIKESFSDGLPSDLQAASNTIANVFSNIEKMLENPDVYGGTGAIARAYARTIPLLKNLEFNSKEYDSVYKSLNETGSMQEVAINSMGQLAVQTDEGYSWVTPEEYHANIEQYRPISNAQLLNQRANSPHLAFQNSVFETLKNGVSIDSITQQILEYANKIGSTEQIQTGYGYVTGGNIMKDFQTFSKNIRLEGFDPKQDDLYSYEVATKSERANAYAMLDIIYNALSPTSKALLKYKSNGTDSGAKGMIAVLMGAATDHSVKMGITLEGGYSKNTESSSSEEDKYFNHTIRAVMGLGREEDFVINPGTVNKLSVHGNTVPLMVNDQKTIDKNLLSEAQNSAFGKMMDTDNISVAGQHVNASVANKIFLTSKLTTLMDLPYTLDDQGNIIPNYKLLEEKDKVDQHIEHKKWTFKDNYKQIQEFIDREKLSIRYSPTGEVKFPSVKRFMVFNAQFPKEIFEDGKIVNAQYTKGLSDHDADNTYKAILQYNNWTEKDWKQPDDWGWGPDFFASTVVIPIKASYENLLDKPVNADTVAELMERDKEMRERSEKYDYDDGHIGQ